MTGLQEGMPPANPFQWFKTEYIFEKWYKRTILFFLSEAGQERRPTDKLG
jgi:hypothetical protein